MKILLKKLTAVIFAAMLAMPSAAHAYDERIGQALCYQIEALVNAVVGPDANVYGRTVCMAAPAGDGIMFMVGTNKAIFHIKEAKKPWVVAAVAAVGKVLGDNPDVKSIGLFLTDSTLSKTHKHYVINPALAKELQAKWYTGELTLDKGYDRLLKSMDLVDLKALRRKTN